MMSSRIPVWTGRLKTNPHARSKYRLNQALNQQTRTVVPSETSSKRSSMAATKMVVNKENTPVTEVTIDLTADPENVRIVDNTAPGTSKTAIEIVVDEKMISSLIEMFPNIDPEFVRNVYKNEGDKGADINLLVTTILSCPNVPINPERPSTSTKELDAEQFEIIKELLPDADPNYLRVEVQKFASDEKGLQKFVNKAMEERKYPTMKEYLRKQKLSAQQKQYTTEFNVENFIQLFPDPDRTFNDPKRETKKDEFDMYYIQLFFRNKYGRLPAKTINEVLFRNKFKVMECDQIMMKMMKNGKTFLKNNRSLCSLPDNIENIPLLQELAYLTHREEITHLISLKKKQEEEDKLEAKKEGLMETCQCCYDEEIMLKDIFSCPEGCKFCKDCLRKSCEVAFGEGKTEFPCLTNCSAEFSLHTLQSVLPPKMFSKLAQKKALAEIKAAGIEDLEYCPFCDFASIPHEADKIFRCLNPDCMKESCRKCKEPNHLPLKCEEVEKDEDIKARIYIENKMSEALIRKCWRCGTSFFKEEGCNKMTCSCGATMCYICQKPVQDYSHFNGIGGDRFHLCPLYSDNNLLNQQNVMRAAEAAKAEIDPSKLKIDPSVDVIDHYKKRAKELPRERHMEVLERFEDEERARERNLGEPTIPNWDILEDLLDLED